MNTEFPTLIGFLGSTLDALLAVEAVRRGIVRPLGGRLSDKARKNIASGHVYVFNAVESGVNRWTDGRKWTPSRILDNFLVYCEQTPASRKFDPVDLDPARSDTFAGLIKKTVTLCEYHVVSYYSLSDVIENRLQTVSSTPQYKSLRISADLLLSSSLRFMPVVGYDDVGAYYKNESPDLKNSSIRVVVNQKAAHSTRTNNRGSKGKARSSLQRVPISTPPLSSGSSYTTPSPITPTSESTSSPGITIHFPNLPLCEYPVSESLSSAGPAVKIPQQNAQSARLTKLTVPIRHSPYPPSKPISSERTHFGSQSGDSDNESDTSREGSHSSRQGSTRPSLLIPPSSYNAARTLVPTEHRQIIQSALKLSPLPGLPAMRPCSFPNLAHYAIRPKSS